MTTFAQARKIADTALTFARERGFKPLSIVVLDARAQRKVVLTEDGTPLKRAEVAYGKAHGALAAGVGSRSLMKMAMERPLFIQSVMHVADGALVPVPGGVLIRENGAVIGAVGISGDTSDNDEAAAVAGIEAAGLTADPGA
ncbi:GlcG/HbpS family heme-binding protein [Rhabdaerophilum calidifontis]|uniref:GlcG/HbpS family heme-binding protein n=1 Tax=Rhabdaerophilum calidifontis TaxID=2604328 RepID=UPI00123B1DDE|nr:heme-binding protein [Rhabdaerophilum calidifontis]